MNKYEIMYVVRPNMEEEAFKAIVEHYNTVLTDNGAEVETTDVWGLRELAYEIQKFNKGFYVLLNVNAGVEAINELDRLMLISEDVIRHGIFRAEA
ncbi:MAG: 30S ribosomal protein S6 [Culicoidibacterales bacterium]